ncbi:hypothetical protein EG339_02890 [Chryseobacterium bernardetii]|uniref:Uncharacterized protein n=1 Tax=Chryseobacterium bernardetii TaxID=1241978 RepID=A0A3G6T6Y5_9FLAO|nr:hypothetical protein [Chryseobacterium bernardetii]AZB23639.1 hypothetical protein EG339_02890 [Chryseobacterium bernardetii]
MESEKRILDIAMCIDCGWEGNREECDIDGEFSEWHGRSFEYEICPECGGGVELTNSEHGDLDPIDYTKKLE